MTSERRHKISVDFGPWEIIPGRDEMARLYEFTGLSGPEGYTRFEIRCRLILEGKKLRPFVYFIIEPYILEQKGTLAAHFAPSDAMLDYKFFTVVVEAIATGGNFILVETTFAEQCVEVLMLGRQIKMKLISEAEQLADFALENDTGFLETYSELKRQVLSNNR